MTIISVTPCGWAGEGVHRVKAQPRSSHGTRRGMSSVQGSQFVLSMRRGCSWACVQMSSHCSRSSGAGQISALPGMAVDRRNVLPRMAVNGLPSRRAPSSATMPACSSTGSPDTRSAVATATHRVHRRRPAISCASYSATSKASHSLSPSWTVLKPHGGATINAITAWAALPTANGDA